MLTIMAESLGPDDQEVFAPIGTTIQMSKVKSGFIRIIALASFITDFIEGEGGRLPEPSARYNRGGHSTPY